MTTIALYGGSFDPPHVAHVLAVAYVLSAADVEAVWVLPVGHHVLGKQVASLSRRMHLCRLAFALFGARVQVRDDDALPEATGYTVDLLERLRTQHPDTTFRLVIGSDVLAQRDRWRAFERVCELAPPLVLGRAGFPIDPAFARFAAPVQLPDVSSTQLRADLQAGRDVRGRVPVAVADWLRDHPVADGRAGQL